MIFKEKGVISQAKESKKQYEDAKKQEEVDLNSLMTEYKNIADEIRGITLNLKCMTVDNIPTSNTRIELYQIARISENGNITLTEQGENLPIFDMSSDKYIGGINDLNIEDNYNVAVQELEKYINKSATSSIGRNNSNLVEKGYYIEQVLIIQDNMKKLVPTLIGYTNTERRSAI